MSDTTSPMRTTPLADAEYLRICNYAGVDECLTMMRDFARTRELLCDDLAKERDEARREAEMLRGTLEMFNIGDGSAANPFKYEFHLTADQAEKLRAALATTNPQ